MQECFDYRANNKLHSHLVLFVFFEQNSWSETLESTHHDVTCVHKSNIKYHAYLIRFRMSMYLRTVLYMHRSHLYGFTKEYRNPRHKFCWIKRFCGFEIVNCTWHFYNAKEPSPINANLFSPAVCFFMTQLWKIPFSKREKKCWLAWQRRTRMERFIIWDLRYVTIYMELICGKSIKFTLFSSSSEENCPRCYF